MRYKVGDKVVIRKDLECNTCYRMENDLNEWSYFTPGMCIYTGEQEISSTKDERYQLSSDMDAQKYNFTDGMIDHEATAKLNEVKPIDMLKTGMVVEFRNNAKMLVLVDNDMKTTIYGKQNICFVYNDSFMNGTAYDENLKLIIRDDEFEDHDIIKIYKPDVYQIDTMFFKCDKSNLIWERPIPKPEQKVIKMTSAELLTRLGFNGNTKIEIEG